MAESDNSPSLPSCSPSDLPTPLKLNRRVENPKLEKIYIKRAFKRALSRANTYNKRINNIYFSSHWFYFMMSKFYFPKFYKKLMYHSLKVFSGNRTERPRDWKTGADKTYIANNYLRR